MRKILTCRGKVGRVYGIAVYIVCFLRTIQKLTEENARSAPTKLSEAYVDAKIASRLWNFYYFTGNKLIFI